MEGATGAGPGGPTADGSSGSGSGPAGGAETLDFARRVVHALRNPVGAILLSAESALARADDPEAVRASLRRVVAQAQRCGQILRELIESVEAPEARRRAAPPPPDRRPEGS